MVTVTAKGPDAPIVSGDPILGIVVDMLDTGGYEAVQLREVARRARVSMATIYKRYRTRDELIVAALEGWMDANRYARLPSLIDELPGESMYSDLMHVMRTIFEPWERHPLMLRSYFQARSGPGGKRLIQRGVEAVVPVAKSVLAQADPGFVNDLELILTGVVFGFLTRFAQGEIDVTEIVPGIERTVYWLTQAYQNADAGRQPHISGGGISQPSEGSTSSLYCGQ
ncbi:MULTISPECIES: TetR family transcriptional regulator [Mycobacterium avium complex (MAC)]|uniref:TetR family transcriptional regulator n=4 Tax=Mycobacterium avium complex (MAC) TaxID=120793 RepID=A0A2A3L1Z0_MYCAV|nr:MULTISPECIES: TetR family transcriptional regulator [Mycobacterium avium complex (MAC)]ETB36391.1 TetR family transcriptional regulator [Mycobacterium avium subsp. hominissuis 10-5606]ETB55029.1 TetR family transcriptional regulator [Mycobacterium avium 10-5560]APA76721.1 TetR/AcrR family transcriptional regulator [Mycobacterium avium subsp. hominissuis]AXO22694.1 TetR/AcrR family transcriptional regulator [Mycobacterium avium subsp. hominissuis]ETZ68137.1 bacterial regulatory s, tetR famil